MTTENLDKTVEKSKKALVYFNDLLAGTLVKNRDGYEFMYDDKYISQPNVKPLSKTMPVSQKKYFSDKLFPFFENLLPEGVLLELIVTKLKIDKNNKFELLLRLGQDTVGAVSIIQ